MIDWAHSIWAALSGGLVGFILALIGGGGSILSVPLMVYVVGVSNPHVAIGTSALSVAANACSALVHHARGRNVSWRWGLLYATSGVGGAFLGAMAGKAIGGGELLFIFALLMIVVAVLMLKHQRAYAASGAAWNNQNIAKVVGCGSVSGIVSGFFGIGGGFLIVPGLTLSTRMPMIEAIGTSLIAVTAFGLTTAVSYAMSGLVNWPVAATFIFGGIIGARIGVFAARHLSKGKALTRTFAIFVIAVAIFMLWKNRNVWL